MLKRMHWPTRPRGVTLIEIAVVLVVMSFVLMQLMPSVVDWLQSLKLRNAAESMKAGIEQARMESLKRNSRVTFWMVADASSKSPGASCARSATSPAWVVSVHDPAGKCDAEASLETDPALVTRSAALENASAIQVVSASGGNHVAFTGLGQVVSSGSPITRIDLTLTGSAVSTLRIVVESGGAVRMCMPSAASGDPRACPA